MKQYLDKLKSISLPQRDDLVLALGGLVLSTALLLLIGVPLLNQLEARARLVAVKGNAATLQLAAESYAQQHLGQYPGNVADLVPYLPQAKSPQNPLDGKPLQFTKRPGDVTYHASADKRGYWIKAWMYGPGGTCRELATLLGKAEQTGAFHE